VRTPPYASLYHRFESDTFAAVLERLRGTQTLVLPRTREQRGDAIIERTPLHRFGEPREIAEMVVWLCSSRASFVTGAAYQVDGGWMAT